MIRIPNEANPNRTVYMSGKPTKKDKAEDFIYLDLQIMELYSRLGGDEAIKYLKGKIQLIKKMEGDN